MIVVKKIDNGICVFCDKDASVEINEYGFCATCGDGELLKIVKKCIDGLQQAEVKLTLRPLNSRKGANS